jgi:TPR repeat protein
MFDTLSGMSNPTPDMLVMKGQLYRYGIGRSKNEAEAVKCYAQAALKEHPEALYNLGVMTKEGRGGLKNDINEAINLWKRAARQERNQFSMNNNAGKSIGCDL